eukprot:jgi/Tetstr1/423209/TSEL_001329.t1
MGDSALVGPGGRPRSASMPHSRGSGSRQEGINSTGATTTNPTRLRRSQTDAAAAAALAPSKSLSLIQKLRSMISRNGDADEGAAGATGAASLGSSGSGALAVAEIGIRPSFYWNKAIMSEEERMLAVLSAKSLKSDSQDEVQVVRGFAGRSDWTFVGVFDGHGPEGRAAAKFACKFVQHSMQKDRLLSSPEPKKKMLALKKTCYACQKKMADYGHSGFDAYFSGTTAVFGLLENGMLHIANCGDSRAIVARSSGRNVVAEALTSDAKPEMPSEAKRIVRKGGEVSQMCNHLGEGIGPFRVYKRGAEFPGLAMSRSLGDITAHQVGVTAKPERVSYALKPEDMFVVFASDGIWQVMEDQEVADFVHMYMNARDDTHNCADALTLHAQDMWKSKMEEVIVDDIGVAILHFKELPPVRVKRALHHSNKAAETNDGANQMYRKWERMPHLDPGLVANRMHFNYLNDQAVQEAMQRAQDKAARASGTGVPELASRSSVPGILKMQTNGEDGDSLAPGYNSEGTSRRGGDDHSAAPSPGLQDRDNSWGARDSFQGLGNDAEASSKRVSLACDRSKSGGTFFSPEQLERLSAMGELPVDPHATSSTFASLTGLRRKSKSSQQHHDAGSLPLQEAMRRLAKSFTAGKHPPGASGSSGSHTAQRRAAAARLDTTDAAHTASVAIRVPPPPQAPNYLSTNAAEHINQWLSTSKDGLYMSPDEEASAGGQQASASQESPPKVEDLSQVDPLSSVNLAVHDRAMRDRLGR